MKGFYWCWILPDQLQVEREFSLKDVLSHKYSQAGFDMVIIKGLQYVVPLSGLQPFLCKTSILFTSVSEAGKKMIQILTMNCKDLFQIKEKAFLRQRTQNKNIKE